MGAIQYVRITELREHELQERLSPWMSEARWQAWFDKVAREGIQYPIFALADGRVFNGKHRLRAARELGLAEVAVIYEELTDNQVKDRIIADKLGRDSLTVGQRVCIEINRAEAEGLFEEAERKQIEGGYEGGRGKRKNLSAKMRSGLKTSAIIADRAQVSQRAIEQAIEVKRKRPDLYQRLFNGYDETGKEVRIGTVYAEMKRDEAIAAGIQPEEKRKRHDERIAEIEEEARAVEESAPSDEGSDDLPDTDSAVISARKYVFDATTALVSTYRLVGSAGEGARKAYLTQLESFVEGALILLDRYADDSDKSAMLSLCLEVFKKAKESNKNEEE
ncbi:MT-A70 family protein [Brevibacillus borstelensis AK1]|uniref:MT-A70 family protein n=1 Tax=Brevibacillus borstelensis AK1 TaxID=1300222 RepID=M8DEK8_9BACL|nr:ParB/RepB/Spo0J family partition protein [Brevibacillus borstelensis]EMT54784.1 MT-A70 family protein [Brevibacillus borstelensis AK1]